MRERGPCKNCGLSTLKLQKLFPRLPSPECISAGAGPYTVTYN
jgi:hypothetical protein